MLDENSPRQHNNPRGIGYATFLSDELIRHPTISPTTVRPLTHLPHPRRMPHHPTPSPTHPQTLHPRQDVNQLLPLITLKLLFIPLTQQQLHHPIRKQRIRPILERLIRHHVQLASLLPKRQPPTNPIPP